MADPLILEVVGPVENKRSWMKSISTKASTVHAKVPGIRKLPFSAVSIIVLLVVVNVAVWIIAGIVLVCIPRVKGVIKKILTGNSNLTSRNILFSVLLQECAQLCSNIMLVEL
jgi:hypothetical protein